MSADSAQAAVLMQIIDKLALTINYISVIIGPIGGVCNLLTFTAPKLRGNPTVVYLLCASIFQIPPILFTLPTRIALDNYGNTLEHRSIVFCKLRYYLGLTWPQLVTYYMSCATVDRYFVTSHRAAIRAWSHPRVAYRLSAVLPFVIHAATIHALVFYTNKSGMCQISPGTVYTVIFAIYLILIISVLPHLLMLIFSLLTLRNLRQTRQRILPAIEKGRPERRFQRFEIQLIKIIIVQVIVSSILVLLRLGSYSYSTMTSANLNKTAYARAVEVFSVRMGIALYYFSFAISFYASTLSSKSFRQVFWRRTIEIYGWARRWVSETR